MVVGRSEETPPAPGSGKLAARALFLLWGLATVAAPVVESTGRGHRIAALERLVEDSGIASRKPDAVERLSAEPDPLRGTLVLATALVAEAADPSWLASVDPDERIPEARQLHRRLEMARKVSEDAWLRRPASWRAPLVVGGARYLDLVREADPSLFTDVRQWAGPLRIAVAAAPARAEPEAFLCSSYLPLWSSLDENEKGALLPVVERCLAHPSTFRRFLGPWLAFAGDEDDAHSAIPAEPEAWAAVADHFAEAGRLERAAAALRRRDDLARTEVETAIEDALRRAAWGDARGATTVLHRLLARIEPDGRELPLVVSILERSPPGLPSATASRRIRRHFDWAIELCQLGRCPLEGAELERLAAWSRIDEPADRATLLAAIGDTGRAEAVAARAEAPLSTARWSPFLLLQARALLDEGQGEEAVAALDRLPLEISERPRARIIRAAVTGTEVETRRRWGGMDWEWSEGVPRLEVLIGEPATGLRILISDGPAGGGLVAVRWDGETVTVLPAEPGSTLDAPVPIRPGAHLIEIRARWGGRFFPGEVLLLSAARELSESRADGSPPGPPRRAGR